MDYTSAHFFGHQSAGQAIAGGSGGDPPGRGWDDGRKMPTDRITVPPKKRQKSSRRPSETRALWLQDLDEDWGKAHPGTDHTKERWSLSEVNSLVERLSQWKSDPKNSTRTIHRGAGLELLIWMNRRNIDLPNGREPDWQQQDQSFDGNMFHVGSSVSEASGTDIVYLASRQPSRCHRPSLR
jgi:hypothetical protein